MNHHVPKQTGYGSINDIDVSHVIVYFIIVLGLCLSLEQVW